MDITPPPRSGTESAVRVADVMLVLASGPRWRGVTEIGACIGVNKTVVHRILRSLETRHLVVADPIRGRYALGAAAAALGARALDDLDLRGVSLPVLRRLQSETGETATMSALVGRTRVYIDQVVSGHEIKMTVEVGRPLALHLGASGKAMLAFAPAELREEVLDAVLPEASARRRTLEADLERVTSDGVAVSAGERLEGAASVAAPIFHDVMIVAGAISICGPTARFGEATVARYRELVRVGADEISASLRARNMPQAEGRHDGPGS